MLRKGDKEGEEEEMERMKRGRMSQPPSNSIEIKPSCQTMQLNAITDRDETTVVRPYLALEVILIFYRVA